MKRFFVFTVFCGLCALLFMDSCDKINPPYIESGELAEDTTPKRKFVIEEFTGHTCPNCPQGAAVLQQLEQLYGERLIIISIHCGDFAEPGAGEFNIDFRTATGNDIFSFFTPGAFPSGMVSRTGWTQAQNNAVIDKDAWGTQIETLKNIDPYVSLEIETAYDSLTRNVDAIVECDVLADFSGVYKIAVYITEDSIVHAQMTQDDPENPDNIVHNYVHRHVLRGTMNSTWGDTLVSGNMVTGVKFVKNYSSVLNIAWNEKQCYVVAFVYDASNYEIIQAEEKIIQ